MKAQRRRCSLRWSGPERAAHYHDEEPTLPKDDDDGGLADGGRREGGKGRGMLPATSAFGHTSADGPFLCVCTLGILLKI